MIINSLFMTNTISKMKTIAWTCIYCVICFSCTPNLPEALKKDSLPEIFPDYTEITIPTNIAPLNFRLKEKKESIAVFTSPDQEIQIKSQQGKFCIPVKKWKKLIKSAVGNTICVTIYARESGEWVRYNPFQMFVAKETVDSWLVYRRIAPGYRMWNEMGIYQRCLEDFTEEPLIENKHTGNSCVNCHSFCMNNPSQMLFHQRANYAGTYLITDDFFEKLNPIQSTKKRD